MIVKNLPPVHDVAMSEVSQKNLARFAEIAFSIDKCLGKGSYVDDVIASVPDSGKRYEAVEDIEAAAGELLALLSEDGLSQCRADLTITLTAALSLLRIRSRKVDEFQDLEADLAQLYYRQNWLVGDDQACVGV